VIGVVFGMRGNSCDPEEVEQKGLRKYEAVRGGVVGILAGRVGNKSSHRIINGEKMHHVRWTQS
jgi:hypothetical protein